MQKPAARKQPQRYDVVCEFFRKIHSTDENNRQDISAEDLIHQLNDGDIQLAITYAKTWPVKRDEIRSRKEENACMLVRWQVAKAEFSRQRIAQESKKMTLAVLMRRLAVGSSSAVQFDQNLKKTMAQKKTRSKSFCHNRRHKRSSW